MLISFILLSYKIVHLLILVLYLILRLFMCQISFKYFLLQLHHNFLIAAASAYEYYLTLIVIVMSFLDEVGSNFFTHYRDDLMYFKLNY